MDISALYTPFQKNVDCQTFPDTCDLAVLSWGYHTRRWHVANSVNILWLSSAHNSMIVHKPMHPATLGSTQSCVPVYQYQIYLYKLFTRNPAIAEELNGSISVAFTSSCCTGIYICICLMSENSLRWVLALPWSLEKLTNALRPEEFSAILQEYLIFQ